MDFGAVSARLGQKLRSNVNKAHFLIVANQMWALFTIDLQFIYMEVLVEIIDRIMIFASEWQRHGIYNLFQINFVESYIE